MIQILKLALSGFNEFIGFIIILVLLIFGLCRVCRMLARVLMVRKHGWPPDHLNADGDFKEDNEDDSVNIFI